MVQHWKNRGTLASNRATLLPRKHKNVEHLGVIVARFKQCRRFLRFFFQKHKTFSNYSTILEHPYTVKLGL